jgi:curved DNA-binding protein CbpA
MAERPFFRRKKRKKEKIENLYKILGTRSNISQERIKEKYIEKLREFPPETHPEEFQEIRRAYETLKDPKKRKQYDMMRKYGDKIESIMEEVRFLMVIENYKKAEKLLKYVDEIDPDNIVVKLTQAELALAQEKFERFYSLIDELLEKCDTEKKEYIIFIKFTMLITNGYEDRALEALEHGKEYIVNKKDYHRLRINAFVEMEDYKKAWGEFKYAIPSIEDIGIDEVDILITWLNTAIDLEKWGEISKIQNYFRKLSKTIIDEEEISILKDQLLEEAESYADAARYRAADVFMQIVSQIDQKDIYIKERKREIQRIAKLDMELSRSLKDMEMFPYVHMKVLDLYYSKYSCDECYADFLNEYPHDMMSEMECMKEEIAYGVLRMKKKYPSLYKEFNKELVELFNESTEGLNREQRRRLK